MKLQSTSKVPISLNINMAVDEKSLAAEMFKKMGLPEPVAPKPKPPAPKKKPVVKESSSESESSSNDEEEESKFQVVQRYKNSKPLMLRPD